MFAIKHRKTFLIISIGIFVVSIGLVLSLGLKLGIDFTGGSLTEVSYDNRVEKTVLGNELNNFDLGNFSLRQTVTDTGREGYVLRTRDLTDEERQTVETVLLKGGGGQIERFTSIGPVIGEELKAKAQWAIAGVVLIIVIYVAFAFRGVGKPVTSWKYGGITILALIHDVLVPTAAMAVMGYIFGVEVDVLFVMALLAVVGYSVNDTIVVFDRVRENLIRYRQEKKSFEKDEYGQKVEKIDYVFTKPFADIVGESVSQTILRSINTSVTTLLALGALYFLGGAVTETFALILMIGVLAGTYSSIFLANPILVWVAERDANKSTAT